MDVSVDYESGQSVLVVGGLNAAGAVAVAVVLVLQWYRAGILQRNRPPCVQGACACRSLAWCGSPSQQLPP